MRILVIEDQRRLADNIVKGLKQEKYQAESCYDGASALEAMSKNSWDIVVLDWMLPGKSGPEILKIMREKNDATPVIFLTARGEISDKIDILKTGADDYIVKPFDFHELLARISVILRRPKTYTGIVLEVDNLQLDTTTKQVKRRDITLDLSHTEYRLLEYLMRHQSHIKSESQILENVWDYADDSFSNKVSVYIRYLRNKIDRAFPNEAPLIHTVRGFGYKISL